MIFILLSLFKQNAATLPLFVSANSLFTQHPTIKLSYEVLKISTL